MRLNEIRAALDGGVPASLATCSANGLPNITHVWKAYYVDDGHIALAFQFFNKTRSNIAVNPSATLQLTDSRTGVRYRLSLRYERTEGEGSLYRSVRAQLAGVASHTGTGGVFDLVGVDVYQVLDVERVPGAALAAPGLGFSRVGAVRQLTQRMAGANDLSQVLDIVLDGLVELFDMRQILILCVDETGKWLYTVASRGYQESGVGSEVMIGEGIIGMSAQCRTSIRLACLRMEYSYGRALRAQAVKDGLLAVNTEIPFPGLAEPQSQLAVPIEAGDWLAGVLYVESDGPRRFDYEDEDALASIASHLALAMRLLIQPAEIVLSAAESKPVTVSNSADKPVIIRYFAATQSIFLGDDYLIKGVAGAVLWLLLNDHQQDGRTDFTNRELRLDSRLRLPEVDDNLETRLILLQRRLAERSQWLRIEKLGRGRFRLVVERPIRLTNVEQEQGAGRDNA